MSKQYLTLFLGLGLLSLTSCTSEKKEAATQEVAVGEQIATPVEAVTQVAENDSAASELDRTAPAANQKEV